MKLENTNFYDIWAFGRPPSYAAPSSHPALLRTISVTQVASIRTLLDSSGRDDSMRIFFVLQNDAVGCQS